MYGLLGGHRSGPINSKAMHGVNDTNKFNCCTDTEAQTKVH